MCVYDWVHSPNCLCNTWGCVFSDDPFLFLNIMRIFVHSLIIIIMNHWPLFRVRSWSNDASFMLCYVLIIVAFIWQASRLNYFKPISPLIARFIGPTWGPPWADRTQVGPMLAPWTLLSGSRPQGFARFGNKTSCGFVYRGLGFIFKAGKVR